MVSIKSLIFHADSQPLKGLTVSPQHIFLDNVQCTGTETSLLECNRNLIGQHNCEQFDGAGVRCGGMYVCM